MTLRRDTGSNPDHHGQSTEPLDKRRKSVRNIRKITRTMELIANARFKKAMDRAVAASSFPSGSRNCWRPWCETGVQVQHPLLETHASRRRRPSCWC